MSIVNSFIAKLDGEISDKDLKIVAQELEIFLCDFDITRKSTEIATMGYYPECYKIFLVSKRVSGCSNGTIQAYKLELDYFFQRIDKPLTNITTSDIMLFLYELQTKGKLTQNKPVSSCTAEHIRRILNSFFEWARKNEYVKSNPLDNIDKIRAKSKLRRPLTEFELESIRFALSAQPLKWHNPTNKIRNQAIFEVLYSTGCRISELVSMNIEDVNFNKGEIVICGKGNKERIVYLNAKAELYLKEYLKNRSDNNPALFVSLRGDAERIHQNGVRMMLKRLANLPEIQGNIFPHRIRHTTATHALNHGMKLEEVQQILGHSSPETTLIYAKLAQDVVKSDFYKCVI